MSATKTAPGQSRALTIPAGVAEVYFVLHGGLEAGGWEALARCGRVMGRLVECDLGLVADALGGEVAASLAAWAGEVEAFWQQWSEGVELPAVVVHRRVVEERQRDGRDGKQDLCEVVEAFEMLGGLGEVLSGVLARDVDWAQIADTGAPWGLRMAGEGSTRDVTVVVEGVEDWPEVLGGVAADNEIARMVTMSVNHAAWRDRKTRRLVAVEVIAEEIWPRP